MGPQRWRRVLYALEIKKKDDVKSKKTKTEESEALGGSSAKVSSEEGGDEEAEVVDVLQGAEPEADSYEAESSHSISSVTDDGKENDPRSMNKKKREELAPAPEGWFPTFLFVWVLLGPLADEPADFFKIAGAGPTVPVSVLPPTTMDGIKDAAAKAGQGGGAGHSGKGNGKKSSQDLQQMEKKNKIMELAVAASEANTEQLKCMNDEVKLDTAIKRKEKLIDLLKVRESAAVDIQEKTELCIKRKRVEDELMALLD